MQGIFRQMDWFLHMLRIKDRAYSDSQAAVPYLPEDIWSHIHSLMSMRDAARAACLSRAFLFSWRCRPNLTLDSHTLYSNRHGGNLSTIIDSILRNHSGIGLKILDLTYSGYSVVSYINCWLQVAVTPGIEKLKLSLYDKGYYNFPCSVLSVGVRSSIRSLELETCTFRPTAELGPFRSLTYLSLHSVRITGDELGCLLSKCPALEELYLYDCMEITCLKIPCVQKQLSCLTVDSCSRLRVIENKAPNLSTLDYFGGNVLGETKQMKSLSMNRSEGGVCYARVELPSTMPNLETLYIWSDKEAVNTPILPTKFHYLKHLTIGIYGVSHSSSYDCFSLVSFLDASPSLQTLYLDVSKSMEHESISGGSSHLRKLPEHCRYERLKSVKIKPFSSAKSLVELTRGIVKSAVSLKHLTLDTVRVTYRCSGESSSNSCWSISKADLDGAARAATAIRDYIEDVVPATVELAVLGPCNRCHSIPVDGYGPYKV